MSWGLLTRAWIGHKAVVWVAPCRPALYRIAILGFGTGLGSGGSKRFIFKGRACTESSFLDFGTGPGFGEV